MKRQTVMCLQTTKESVAEIVELFKNRVKAENVSLLSENVRNGNWRRLKLYLP